MSGYLERLKKNSALIGTAETAETAESLCAGSFGSFGSFGSEGNAEFFLSEDDRPNPSGSFGSSPPWEFVDFPAARCCACSHGQRANPGDAYSWHRCTAGQPGWWGMAAHRCADWKAADHAEERPAPDPLAAEIAALVDLVSIAAEALEGAP